LLLNFLDNFKNVRLVIVVSVGADSQIDFTGIWVTEESNVDTNDWVWRSHGDFSENVGKDDLVGQASDRETL
jgi:hypothetical protein